MLTRKTFILVKSETTYGVDAAPVAADAVRIVSLEIDPIAGDRVQRTTLQGFLGARRSLIARKHVPVTITLELGGSGTAGTAPRFGPLLTSSSLAATPMGTAVTGSAAAGSAGSITLAAGASAVDNFYVGMPIRITSGTGNGHAGVITNYVGSTRVCTVVPYTSTFVPAASSGYSIDANVTYSPASTFEGVAGTSCTIYAVKDQVLHKVTGFRGNLAMNADLNQIGQFQVTGIAKYVTPVAVTSETFTYGAQAEPDIVEAGVTSALRFMNYAPCFQSYTWDLGVATNFTNRVNCAEQTQITDRTGPTGQVVIENPTIAQKDFFSAAADNSGASDGPFVVQHGGTSGKRVILFNRMVEVNGSLAFSDDNGIDMMTIPYLAYPSEAGNDECRLVFA